jgi:hypothetical protein
LVTQNIARIKDPDGLVLRLRPAAVLGGQVLQQLCQGLGPQLCDLLGTGGIAGPLGNLLGPILGLLGP